jgi:predicted transcriptional regulator
MSTPELKKRIKGKVEKIEDKRLLELIYRFVELQENNYSNHELSASQLNGIKRGLADLKAGRVISNDNFEKELNAWFAKEK